MVICLPEQVFSGVASVSFTHRETVDLLTKLAAKKLGVPISAQLPRLHTLHPDWSSGGYYWQSRRALRRTVLHYELAKRIDPAPTLAN